MVFLKTARDRLIEGRYPRFNLLLGRGAYKEVYKAFDIMDQIDVAWNSIDLGCNIIELNECEIMKRLNHPNILKTKDQWNDSKKEKFIFITNFINDGSLLKYFRFRQISLKHLKIICKEILFAIQYLHNNNIIHRDIKCSNIFTEGNNGNIVLGYLGLNCCIHSSMDCNKANTYSSSNNNNNNDVAVNNYNELIN